MTEKVIKEKEREQLLTHFENLQNPVTIAFFTQEMECQFCRETRTILQEVAELSPTIQLTVYDFVKDVNVVSAYSIDKIPAIALLGNGKDYKVRFFGIPTGYEFTPLIQAIISISQQKSILKDETKEKLASLEKDVHIQVFTTVTCPVCPQAVIFAHQFAVESDFVRADMVESVEFPYLAQKYEVFAVPKMVINETHTVEGVLSEKEFADEILKAQS